MTRRPDTEVESLGYILDSPLILTGLGAILFLGKVAGSIPVFERKHGLAQRVEHAKDTAGMLRVYADR